MGAMYAARTNVYGATLALWMGGWWSAPLLLLLLLLLQAMGECHRGRGEGCVILCCRLGSWVVSGE